MRNDASMQAAGFYTVGKDHAFNWMTTNPDASRDELVAALMETGKRWPMPRSLLKETAILIADRVFLVTGRHQVNRSPEA